MYDSNLTTITTTTSIFASRHGNIDPFPFISCNYTFPNQIDKDNAFYLTKCFVFPCFY